MAPVPAGGLAGPWEFWTGSGWSTQQTAPARLLSGVGTAFGVQRLGGQYVLITIDSNLTFSPELVAYTAPAPGGPFIGPAMTAAYLLHGHAYKFKVSAISPAGEGPASATIQVTSLGGLPLPPSNLVATAGDGQVTPAWAASPTPNVWYWVYQRDVTAGETWRKLPVPISSCCAMTAAYLANGHTYNGASWHRWRVIPMNGAQVGPASSTIDIRIRGQAIYAARNILGDSYSAGVGAGYEYGSCPRSQLAWGFLLNVYAGQSRHQACTGAVINGVYSPQLGQLHVPGATLITLTIGGNDAGFIPRLADCAKHNLAVAWDHSGPVSVPTQSSFHPKYNGHQAYARAVNTRMNAMEAHSAYR